MGKKNTRVAKLALLETKNTKKSKSKSKSKTQCFANHEAFTLSGSASSASHISSVPFETFSTSTIHTSLSQPTLYSRLVWTSSAGTNTAESKNSRKYLILLLKLFFLVYFFFSLVSISNTLFFLTTNSHEYAR